MTNIPAPVRATLNYIGELNSDTSPQSQWCQRTFGYMPQDNPRRTAACMLLVAAAFCHMPLKRPVQDFNQQIGSFAAAERMLNRTSMVPKPGARVPFAFESEDGQRLG